MLFLPDPRPTFFGPPPIGAIGLALVIALTVNSLKDSFPSRPNPTPQVTSAPPASKP
jgi:hypothetical protein